jgi:hypothetical protein
VKPTIPQVLPLLQHYYDHHGGGGALHILIEDFNVEDGHVLRCYDSATNGPGKQRWIEHMKKNFPGSRTVLEAEREPVDHEGAALALVLLAMSKTQRLKIAHMLESR